MHGRGKEIQAVSGHWISKARRKAIHERDGWRCVYCQLMTDNLTLDHVKPRSKGGSHRSTNLVTACFVCNSARGNRSVRGFCIGVSKYFETNWRETLARVKNQAKRKIGKQVSSTCTNEPDRRVSSADRVQCDGSVPATCD